MSAEAELPTLFAGVSPAALAEVIGDGWATWVRPAAAGERVAEAQAAIVSPAPPAAVYTAVTQVERMGEFGAVSLPTEVHRAQGDRVDATLHQGLRFGPFRFGLRERFELQRIPGRGLRTLRYVEGSFSEARFDARVEPLEGGGSLLMLSFYSDLRSVGRLARAFFRHQPEVDFAITGSVPVLPALTFAREAERQSGRAREQLASAPRPLWEGLQEEALRPALRQGFLTVGRLAASGGVRDVCTATRIQQPIERVYAQLLEPEALREALSFVESVRVSRRSAAHLDTELVFRVRIGPLRKRYTIQREASLHPPHTVGHRQASIEGRPLIVSDHLLPDGSGTLVCHRYFTDLKRDRLLRIFLQPHPDFEWLISCYAPLLLSRAWWRLLAG